MPLKTHSLVTILIVCDLPRCIFKKMTLSSHNIVPSNASLQIKNVTATDRPRSHKNLFMSVYNISMVVSMIMKLRAKIHFFIVNWLRSLLCLMISTYYPIQGQPQRNHIHSIGRLHIFK